MGEREEQQPSAAVAGGSNEASCAGGAAGAYRTRSQTLAAAGLSGDHHCILGKSSAAQLAISQEEWGPAGGDIPGVVRRGVRKGSCEEGAEQPLGGSPHHSPGSTWVHAEGASPLKGGGKALRSQFRKIPHMGS